MTKHKYTGSCLCGKVSFEITGELKSMIMCHCSQCRKAQGSAFATNGIVDVSDFTLVSGEDELTSYESTPGKARYFCKYCGSPIYSRNDTVPDKVRVRIGSIDSDISERPVAHIFASSKANWEEIEGEIPQFDSYEPGRK